MGFIVELPEEPGFLVGLSEAADGQVIGNRNVKRGFRFDGFGTNQLHQGVQAVEGQGIRVVNDGPEFHCFPIAGDGEGTAAVDIRVNRMDQRLGGVLNVLDERLQHDESSLC